MPPRDVALALLVIFLWGANYVFIKIGLRGVSPFVLAALRLFFTAIPAVFFIPRPRLPLRNFVAFGTITFFAQFAVLFWAMKLGMPSGLTSVVQQAQIFFTILLAAIVFDEKPKRIQLAGMCVSALGLVWLGFASASTLPMVGFFLVLAAGAFWAIGNNISRTLSRYGQVDGLGFVVWSALIPPLPFLALACLVDGPTKVAQGFREMGAVSWASVAYLSLGATLVAFGIWNRLLKRHPVAQVARFALLLPVISLAGGFVVLGEHVTPAQLAASALVVAGLALPLAANRFDVTQGA